MPVLDSGNRKAADSAFCEGGLGVLSVMGSNRRARAGNLSARRYLVPCVANNKKEPRGAADLRSLQRPDPERSHRARVTHSRSQSPCPPVVHIRRN